MQCSDHDSTKFGSAVWFMCLRQGAWVYGLGFPTFGVHL